MARPSKLTPEVEERILEYLRAGNRRNVAVRAAGVGESTFFHWMADDRPRYREFRDAAERAEAEAEVALVEAVVKGIPKNPMLAYKMLENRSADWRRWRIAPEPDVGHGGRPERGDQGRSGGARRGRSDGHRGGAESDRAGRAFWAWRSRWP